MTEHHNRQGSIPARTIRVDAATWDAARAKAAERGETVTEVIRRALRRYARS